MLWVEMAFDEEHGGGSWGFGKCLWSPSRTKGDHPSGYWELLLKVRPGDIIIHIRRDNAKRSFFCGASIADSSGFVTERRPPQPKDWGYADKYNRVNLRDYEPFTRPIYLNGVFEEYADQLTEYYQRNKDKKRPPDKKKRIFYVVQSGRLQGQNGAYLTEMDEHLYEIVFGKMDTPNWGNVREGIKPSYGQETPQVNTGVVKRDLTQRVGQDRFSDAVRRNYERKCCFPGCNVDVHEFLVGSHIARWADEPSMRGKTSNGFCLCLLHDRAFEQGLFTLDAEFRVRINPHHPLVKENDWCQSLLKGSEGKQIRLGIEPPDVTALQRHWDRICYYPD